MNTLEIQQALHAKGFDPGLHDGIMGARTRAAIRAFQDANGLVVDGIVGPITTDKLFTTFKPSNKTVAPINPAFPWYAEAWRLRGIKEVGGAGDNEVIKAWATDLDIPYRDDETPWCGLFVAHCVGSQLSDEPLPTVPLRARSWEDFGDKVHPQPAAVMVFWRGSPNGGNGHVGFYAGEDESHFHVLGGNQSDMVSVTRVPREKFLEARWPSTVPAAKGKPLKVSAAGVGTADKLH